MHRFFYVCVILFFSAFTAFADGAKISLASKLNDDFQTGAISRAEYVAYRLMGILHHPDLPSSYQSYQRQPSRMGTALMMEAWALANQSSDADKSLLQTVLSRPVDLPLSHISPSGLFKLHYTNEGRDAAADTFITQAAQAYDDVYALMIEDLGFDPPPIDDPLAPEYDVYVYAVGGYGLSTPEFSAPSAQYPYGATSFISMDSKFEITYTRGVPGMLVTAAHEFFHMVQIGMRNFPSTEIDSRFLYEGMATWMEDFAYDEINDYLQYLPHYLQNLSKSFNTFNGLHEYGSCIFYHMLEQKYGVGIIKSIWIEFATKGVWGGFDAALQQVGSSFSAELAEHMVWNYFTGERADPARFYEEGEFYPLVQPHDSLQVEEVKGFSGQTAPLSANYIRVDALTLGDLMVQPEMDEPSHWLYSTILEKLNQPAEVSTVAATKSLWASAVSPATTFLLVPTNIYKTSRNTSSMREDYGFTVTLGVVDDIVAGIQSVFPNPFQPAVHPNGVRIDVRLAKKTAKINYAIVSENGRTIIAERLDFSSAVNGDVSLFWDGTNHDGELVTSGIYVIYIDADQEIVPKKIAVIR